MLFGNYVEKCEVYEWELFFSCVREVKDVIKYFVMWQFVIKDCLV